MSSKNIKKSNKQKAATIRILLLVGILIAVNILGSYFHGGLDLTAEKRFTMSAPTKRMLKNMKETAFIEVYLDGQLTAELQKMQEAVRERLSAFRDASGNRIYYKFIDPFEGKKDEEKKQIAMNLHQKGIEYMQLPTREEDGYSVRICFPYALLHYNGKELPINLLENLPGQSRSEQTTYAEALLEYKFASALNQLAKPTKPRIGYLLGHGEDRGESAFDLLSTLSEMYTLDSINLANSLHISNAYDLLIINQPLQPFTDPEKLKIDQYLMRGGHILFALSPMNPSMDSFSNGAQKILAFERGLNLDDMLFKYGTRINNDLIEDLQCLPIPMMTGGPKPQMFPWVYFPRINPTSNHPIVKNMDFIQAGFTSSIDTILTSGIKKTILLQSSKYSRVAASPVTVSLTKLNYPGKPENYNKPYRPVAVLAEGKFYSMYNNRLAPSYLRTLDSLGEPYKNKCDSNSAIIVTSIGGVFKNDFTNKDGQLALGYYKFTGEFFANKGFLLNCVEYLTDKSGILEARSKDVKLRLLDAGRAKEEQSQWQFVNVGIPIALVLIFASAYIFFRKRKYETVSNPTKK